jgi:general secretion pathway protein G
MTLVLASLSSAQDRATFEKDLDRAIELLYSEKAVDSDLGRQELVDMGRRAIPKLMVELAGRGAPNRKPNARVRRLICEILGESRDNSPHVIDALAARLTDTEEFGLTVAAAAAHALGRIADERAVSALLKALTSKQTESDRWLKYHCIVALGMLRAGGAVDPLLKALEDKGAAEVGGYEKMHLIRAAAADALGRLVAKEAVEPLGKLLSDAEMNPSTQTQVGVHAARALERILGESKGPLTGSGTDVTASLDAWRKWWTGEETRKNVVKAKVQVAEIAAAIEKFKKDFGKYPTVLDYLKEKPVGEEYAKYPAGGYYSGELKDPWGSPFIYDAKGENGAPFDIISHGRDKRPWGGGDDADIWNHDKYKAIRLEKTKKAMEEIVAALEKYKADTGAYPKALDDLKKKPEDPSKNGGNPYLASIPTDGYGGPFRYGVGTTQEAPYDLWSQGADRREGGTDTAQDVWNHDKWKAPRVEKAVKHVQETGAAVEKFREEQEKLPAKLDDLRIRPAWVKAGKWPDRGYAAHGETDPFGNPLVYKPAADGKSFELKSLGADGAEGGTGPDADIPYAK